MDIFDTAAASDKGAWVHLTNQKTGEKAYLTDKSGEPDPAKPCRICVLGPDSAEYRRKVANRVAERTKENGGKANDVRKMTQAQIVALLEDGMDANAQDTASATVGWENLPLPDDLAEFSHENAVAMYKKYPAIHREVDAFREVTANFFDQA